MFISDIMIILKGSIFAFGVVFITLVLIFLFTLLKKPSGNKVNLNKEVDLLIHRIIFAFGGGITFIILCFVLYCLAYYL